VNIQPAKFSGTSKEFLDGEIICPTCHQVWGTVDFGIYSLREESVCPHLKFYIENADGKVSVRYFNGFTPEELMNAVEVAGRSIAPDLHGKTVEQFLAWQQSEDAFWRRLKCTSVDTVLVHVECDGNLGEHSYNYTVHFGACLR